MLVDDSLRVVAKHLSPTTTPMKSSKPSSSEKVPCSQAPPEPRKPNVPSIVIDDKLNTTVLVKTLETLNEKRIMGKMIAGQRLKVFPKTSEDQRKIQRHMVQTNLKSYAFEIPDEKQLKLVIRGLPEDHTTPVKFLPNSLAKNLSQHMSVICGFNTNFPLFLEMPTKTRENAAIYRLTSIGYYKVTFEDLRRKDHRGNASNVNTTFIIHAFARENLFV
ncbi:hypothetical protein AVEN_127521-1 [Araneus ventricosus]|uniref:Pre-C2HC domain-containing protein n=1 Tax=Araneus ventricosus TaxID=182803 RepID=A0A4Y2MLR8_ARAVE|nr:hypothetical protein AVEN_127521-1 [Araneus ventricosus]